MTVPSREDAPLASAAILDALDTTWNHLRTLLAQLEPVLADGPDGGGWTPRQILSHIVGAWQRIPLHAAFILANSAEVPILIDDDYWTPEWQTAPLLAFKMVLEAAYVGNRQFIAQLTPAELERSAQTPFGPMTLGELLAVSCQGHIAGMHLPQLEAFLAHS